MEDQYGNTKIEIVFYLQKYVNNFSSFTSINYGNYWKISFEIFDDQDFCFPDAVIFDFNKKIVFNYQKKMFVNEVNFIISFNKKI